MKPTLQKHFKAELSNATSAIAVQDFDAAWTALQRAHMLGQRDAIAHLLAHWAMLTLAWRQRDFREVAGQLFPVLLAVPLTVIFGRFRTLRSGRANTHSLEEMPIPDDVQHILNQ